MGDKNPNKLKKAKKIMATVIEEPAISEKEAPALKLKK